jgi:Domain of unknown function (DUF5597)/Beta-galactosidase
MMIPSIRAVGAVVCAVAISAAYAQTRPADPALPHFEKRGVATQLIVDGKPFLVLGAEPPTSAPSNIEYLRYSLSALAATHQNAAEVAIGWNWIEPEKGKYDFRIMDAAIEDARKIDQRTVLVWFGSWKNGDSDFAPAWVKADQDRFPRAQGRDGKTIPSLSAFSENNSEADARAFAALMRHIREVDKSHRVIMVQVENEIGINHDSRDWSGLANRVYAAPVPAELMDYLAKHKADLHEDLRKVWEAAGSKTSGTWEEVFGKGPEGDETFMAWNYARYINRVTEAGKKEYPVPMFVNVWGTTGWGKSPRGEAIDHLHDVWRAGAPQVDMFCPDAYMGRQGAADRIVDLTKRYVRNGNLFFTVEAADGEIGAAHAFYAIGQQRAIGYSGMGNDGLLDWFTRTGINSPAWHSPAGLDSPARLIGFGGPTSPAPLPPIPPEYEAKALSQAFLTMQQIAPQILEHQSKGTIAGVALDKQRPEEKVKLGNYILNVELPRGRGAQAPFPDSIGYGLFMATGPDEYLIAGNNLMITFTPATPGPPLAGIAEQAPGRFDKNGQWVTLQLLGGDDSSDNVVRLFWGERAIQRVKVYRYR